MMKYNLILQTGKKLILSTVFIGFGALSVTSFAADTSKYITKKDAIQAALAKLDVEVLGIRFDKPDIQWDVFIRSGKDAYEIEVDALNGKIIALEKETLKEIQAELLGDLSHEGVDGDIDK